MKTIIGLFSEITQAESAVTRFKEAGFAEKNIGIIVRGYFVKDMLQGEPTSAVVAEKAGIGIALGATAGGLLSFLAAGVSLTLPGVGPLLAAGTLAPILVSGITAGAVYGGLLGVFLGLDVPEDEAQFYVDQLKEGAVLVVVHVKEERAVEAWTLMRQSQPIPFSTKKIEA